MRWFIVFLLIANILLFFWVQQEALMSSSQNEIPPPEIGQLRLRNEPPAPDVITAPGSGMRVDDVAAVVSSPSVEPAGVAADDPGPAIAAHGGEPDTAGDQLASAETTAPPLTPEVDNTTEAPAPVPAATQAEEEPAITQSAEPPPAEAEDEDEITAQVPVAETEEPLAAATASIEAQPSDAEAMVAQAPTAAESDVPPAPEGPPPAELTESAAPVIDAPVVEAPAVCARVGPFEPADADALLEKLPGHMELLSDTSEQHAVDDGYYVLIPTLPDRAAGLSKLQELSAAGFTDTWLFRRGPYRNAISLGLFRREGSAKRHASKVAAKGFDVEVQGRTKTEEKRWLQLRQGGDGDIQDALPLPDGVTLTRQDCP